MNCCNEIRVEDGDTCYKLIDITSKQPSGVYRYIPAEGDRLILSVHSLNGEEIIVQKFTCNGRASPSIIIPTDLPEAEYRYTIKLITVTGETHTIVKNEKLIIE